MKRTLSLSLLAVTAAVVLAQDPRQKAPQQFKVLLENDQVRVMEFTAGAGQATPMHSHPPHVILPLADGKTRFTLADGSTRELEIKKGTALYAGAVTHSHLALTDNRVVVVELKTVK